MQKKLKGLAIDTASRLGSISVLNGSRLVDYSYLNKDISRAEDLVVNIGNLLTKNGLNTKDIDFITYCRRHGSYTGIEIAASTSFGISRAGGCLCVGVTKFEALSAISVKGNPSYILIEGDNQNIFYADYSRSLSVGEASLKIKTAKISEINFSEFDINSEVILQKSLYKKFLAEGSQELNNLNITTASDNVSNLIGLKAMEKINNKLPLENEPFYYSKTI